MRNPKYNLKNSFIDYFPKYKNEWTKYLFTALPVMMASMVFALNAFVDNFMSTNIPGGNQSLSYANTWTEIVVGIVSLTTIVGTTLFAQYLGHNNNQKIKEVINMRLLVSFFIALIFCLPVWIDSEFMIRLISGFDKNLNVNILNRSIVYIRLITASWLLNAIWFTLSMILREKHYGTASFISSLVSLLTNIGLNSIFIFGLHKDIEFLAYSTIISNVLGLLYVIGYMFFKDHSILINPFKIFKVSRDIFNQFFRRSLSFILLSISSIAITMRFTFYNLGYGTGHVDNPIYQLSAATILGISGMFFNIFWTMFDSINANVAIYVGKELGADNFYSAKRNAKQLQGFHLVVALVLGLILFLLTFAIAEMNFMADGYAKELTNSLKANGLSQTEINQVVKQGSKIFLENVKYTLWPLALYMPMFVWFINRSKTIASGGYTNIVSVVECTASLLQLGWLSLICFVFNKNNTISFPWAYFIFFIADIPKFIVYEILNKKLNWVRNITSTSYFDLSKDDIELFQLP